MKKQLPELTEGDLAVGKTYRAKRPIPTGFGEWNDRRIVWMGETTLQYDGPAVGIGRHFPKQTKTAFLKWAGSIVETG